MSAERLSDLAMLSIENERDCTLDISKLVDIFAREEARKQTCYDCSVAAIADT